MTEHESKAIVEQPADLETVADERLVYEPPTVVKEQSIARVTLFTGGGTPAVGVATT